MSMELCEMDLQNNMESPKIGLGCHSDTAGRGGGTQNSTDVFMKHNDTKKRSCGRSYRLDSGQQNTLQFNTQSLKSLHCHTDDFDNQ